MSSSTESIPFKEEVLVVDNAGDVESFNKEMYKIQNIFPLY